MASEIGNFLSHISVQIVVALQVLQSLGDHLWGSCREIAVFFRILAASHKHFYISFKGQTSFEGKCFVGVVCSGDSVHSMPTVQFHLDFFWFEELHQEVFVTTALICNIGSLC